LLVCGLPDHLEARVLEQTRDAFTRQHRIVGDDHPHGILALTVVPSPSVLVSSRRPSRAATRSESPRSPEPRAGSAPPMPSSLTWTSTWPLRRTTATLTLWAWAYRATLVRA